MSIGKVTTVIVSHSDNASIKLHSSRTPVMTQLMDVWIWLYDRWTNLCPLREAWAPSTIPQSQQPVRLFTHSHVIKDHCKLRWIMSDYFIVYWPVSHKRQSIQLCPHQTVNHHTGNSMEEHDWCSWNDYEWQDCCLWFHTAATVHIERKMSQDFR